MPSSSAAQASQDQTSKAKALVAAVARAFYDDATIVLVDYLLFNCDFLLDGPKMGKKLKLPTKQIRRTLLFLQAEHLVACENVTAIVETQDRFRTYRRPKTSKFWYINLNLAVHSISLRLHLVKLQITQQYNDACNTSHFECPGHKLRLCNGYYTEEEVQWFDIDPTSGQFLCRECHELHQHNPDPPSHSYILETVNKENERKVAEELLGRYQTQLSSRPKFPSSPSLRPGIMELLREVREISYRTPTATAATRRLPVTENLPSDNGAAEYMFDRAAGYLRDEDDGENDNYVPDALAAGMYFFRNPVNGQLTALDLETTATIRSSTQEAFHRANQSIMADNKKRSAGLFGQQQLQHIKAAAIRAGLDTISHRQEQQAVPEGTIDTNMTNNTATIASVHTPEEGQVEPPEIPRPAKMTCRQSTPYFLRPEFQNSSHSDGCVGLDKNEEDQELLDDVDDWMDDVLDKYQDYELGADLPMVSRTEFLSHFNAELEQKMSAALGPEPEITSSTYASVPYWEG